MEPYQLQACEPMRKFDITPMQACARRRIIENMAVELEIRKWGIALGLDFFCWSGKTERDIRDFIHFASSNSFTYWVVIFPSHIDISDSNSQHWTTISKVDSAQLGDLLESRWIVLIAVN